MSCIRVKVTFESQGRTVNKLVEVDPSSFEAAFRVVKKAFPEVSRLSWKDEEGDLVELESSKDLRMYVSTKPATHRWYAFPLPSVSPRDPSPIPNPREVALGPPTLPKLTKPPVVEFVPLSERVTIWSSARPPVPSSVERTVGFGLGVAPIGDRPKPIAIPKLNARFVKHVTADDESSEYAPRAKFFKTWRFRNDGTLKWPTKISLLYVSKLTGDQLSGPDELPITFASQTEIGKEVDISVPLVAPEEPGEYCGFWKLCDESGRKFGQRVRVRISVVERVSEILFTDSVKRILETLEEEGYVDGIETATHYLVNREVRTLEAIEKKLGDLGIRVSV